PPGYTPLLTETGKIRFEGSTANMKVAILANNPGRWVNIKRPTSESVGFQGTVNLTHSVDTGKYLFSSYLYVPSGTGIISIQFEAFGQDVTIHNNFLHLDFQENGQVVIDDSPNSKFGHFPHDSVFVVQVNLHINANPKVSISLTGAGASGQADKTIQVFNLPDTYKFGSFRLASDTPGRGNFYATNILIEKKL
ncbi:MAG TPA: hypothetical protein VK590_09370, partial [Saprospiraceae bacterium]|nr:hypothetical protein [Saprospiraceae bacterium]